MTGWIAQTTTSVVGNSEASSDDALGSVLGFAFAVVMMLVLVFVIYGEEIFRIIEARSGTGARPSSRLGALEFVEAHPTLLALGDEQALLVARVLREELERQGRTDKRFQIAIALVSLIAGAALGRVVGT